MNKKTINTILIVGGVAVVGYLLFGKRLFGGSTATSTASDSEDAGEGEGSESFSATGAAMRQANEIAVGMRKPKTMEEESEDVENIGIKKAMAKRKLTYKQRCVNAVGKTLGVTKKEAIRLLKERNPEAMAIIAPLRAEAMKRGRRKISAMQNRGAVANMQSTEESGFAFNGFDEID